MSEMLTTSQKQRLAELNAPRGVIDNIFITTVERESWFKTIENQLAKENKEKLLNLLNIEHKLLLCEIESRLVKWLTEIEGFTQVVTPIIISEAMLNKMTITSEHPLAKQVFWLEDKKCLRPMLAPNLYVLMKEVRKVIRQPVKIFETGPCFRKETQGSQHLNEFTMLNFVQLAGISEGTQMENLKRLAQAAMKVVDIDNYELEITKSEVYGETLDIVVGDLELASGAYGPHFLDAEWGVFEPWVGFGFGLERIAMAKAGYQNIKRVGRSVSYLNGARLNI